MYPKKCKEIECRGVGNGKGNTMKEWTDDRYPMGWKKPTSGGPLIGPDPRPI